MSHNPDALSQVHTIHVKGSEISGVLKKLGLSANGEYDIQLTPTKPSIKITDIDSIISRVGKGSGISEETRDHLAEVHDDLNKDFFNR